MKKAGKTMVTVLTRGEYSSALVQPREKTLNPTSPLLSTKDAADRRVSLGGITMGISSAVAAIKKTSWGLAESAAEASGKRAAYAITSSFVPLLYLVFPFCVLFFTPGLKATTEAPMQ